MPISKNAVPILTLDDWETCAGPNAPDHWSDGRSAKEAASAWLEDDAVDLPKELKTALKHHDAFGKVTGWSAEPQVALPSDGSAAGESFVADLVVEAEDEHGPYLIVVDAKSDEPFGDPLGGALAAAVEALLDDQRSTDLEHVVRMAALLGPRRDDDPALVDIRHGLLAASAGCLAEAERRGRSRALLLIQEFVTDRTVDKKLLVNAIDLGRFVKRLSHGAFKGLSPGAIAGPISVPATSRSSADGTKIVGSNGVDFYVGKISRNLRTRRG